GKLDRNHPANFVLMMCVGMSDPGMVVFPTHRLFRGLPAMTANDLRKALGDCFELTTEGKGAPAAESIWEAVETDGEQGALAFYTANDRRWSIARLTSSGKSRLGSAAPDRSDDWRGLSVAILHRLVMDTLLKATNLPKPTYVHLVKEVIGELESGDYPLTALVQPP